MRGSEGPTSAASFHSRLPCNLNRGDIIRPSILSSTWPLGVHPTRDISAPYTAYYLDRLHLTHASRCYSKLRPLPPSLSLLISPFLPLPSGGEIDFHDRATFPDTEDINNVVSVLGKRAFIFIRSTSEVFKIDSFPPAFRDPRLLLEHRPTAILDYSSKKLLLTHGYVYLHTYIYIYSLEITHRGGNLVDKLSVANSYNLKMYMHTLSSSCFYEPYYLHTLLEHASYYGNLYQFNF